KHGLPHRMAGKLFYTKNSGLQNQSVLYWRPEKEGEEDRLLLDPNKLSEDGTVALSGYAVSYGGRHLAYGISRSGSDWQEWKIREVETGKDLDDELKNIKFSSASWSKDNRGFAYGKYNPSEEGDLKESNVDQKVYYHRIGDTQEKDELL